MLVFNQTHLPLTPTAPKGRGWLRRAQSAAAVTALLAQPAWSSTVDAAANDWGIWHWALAICLGLLLAIVVLEALYTARHYLFTINRLFGRQRPIYAGSEEAHWPHITVFIAAHNEEACNA